MSKSLGNTISPSDSPEEIWQSVRKAITDTQKIRKNDPGHPEVCTIFTYQNVFNKDNIKQIEKDCKSGILGCVD